MYRKEQKITQQQPQVTQKIKFIDTDYGESQNQNLNFTYLKYNPAKEQQQEVMIIGNNQENRLIDNCKDKKTKQDKNNINEDKDFSKQFQEIRFYSNTCNLIDMDLEIQDAKKPNSLLSGYEYEKFIQNRCILVQPPQLINQGYITSYKLYQIKSKKECQQQFDTCVSRRFSDFQYLNELLIQKYGGYIIPILPEKNFWATINLEGKQYKQVRTKHLNNYLNRLFRHKKLRFCNELKSFLFQDDAIFSTQKGQHTQKKSHIEEKLKFIGTGALEYGKSLYNKFIGLATDKQVLRQNQQIRLNKNKLTKQDLTFSEYQIVVSELMRITKQLKILVQNTIQQIKRIQELNAIFDSDIASNNQSEKNSLRQSSQYQSMSIKIQNDNLYEQFQQLCQFIQSCYSAIQRRNNLRQEISALKDQEQDFLQKYKNSPRSLQLDLIRSKLNKLNKMNETYAQELIHQLQIHADQGKGKLKCFVLKFESLKAEFYANPTFLSD